mgnify:CR=1 FL=1
MPGKPAGSAGIASLRGIEHGTGEHFTVVMPLLNFEAYAALGQIVARWSVLEFFISLATEMLADSSAFDLPSVERKETKSKIKLWHDVCAHAFAGRPSILQFLSRTRSRINKGKRIRDHIAHSQIVGQPSSRGLIVTFIDPKIKGNRDKRYTLNELNTLAAEISRAAGEIDRLVLDHQSLPFSSQDIQLLQRFLDPNRWNQATLKALKSRSQPLMA